MFGLGSQSQAGDTRFNGESRSPDQRCVFQGCRTALLGAGSAPSAELCPCVSAGTSVRLSTALHWHRPFCLRGSRPLPSPGAGAGQGGLLHPSLCWLCRAGPCCGAQPRRSQPHPAPSRPAAGGRAAAPLAEAGPCPAHCGRGEGRRRLAQAARVPVTHCRYEPANQRAPSGVPARCGFFLESSSAGKSSPAAPHLPSLHTRPCGERGTLRGPSSPPRGAARGCGEAARGVREGPHGQRGGGAGTRFAAPFPRRRGSGAERSGRAVRRFMRQGRRAGRAQCEASRRAGSLLVRPVQPSASSAPRSRAETPW